MIVFPVLIPGPKFPFPGTGREIWGLYYRESRKTGIPAHPCYIHSNQVSDSIAFGPIEIDRCPSNCLLYSSKAYIVVAAVACPTRRISQSTTCPEGHCNPYTLYHPTPLYAIIASTPETTQWMYDISYLGPRTDIAKLLINCNLPLYIEISSHRIDIRLMLTMTGVLCWWTWWWWCR